MLQLLAHLIGDYLLQSHWMANEKTKSWIPAGVHALAYSVPFLVLLDPSWEAWLVITSTHFVIDRWRLARYVCWAKNWLLSPPSQRRSWAECRATGFTPETPTWMAVWLLIIADNTLHLIINALALYFFP